MKEQLNDITRSMIERPWYTWERDPMLEERNERLKDVLWVEVSEKDFWKNMLKDKEEYIVTNKSKWGFWMSNIHPAPEDLYDITPFRDPWMR